MALGTSDHPSNVLNGWQQQSYHDHDNCDDNQQLDQRKTATTIMVWAVHGVNLGA